MPDFEADARRANERLREDARAGGPGVTVIGFEDDEGQPRPLIGDDEAPYVSPLGRATTTPNASNPGVPAVATGQNQRLLTDEFGRLITLTAQAPADSPTLVSLVPQVANAGVLVVSAVPAELFEAWVGDYQQLETRFLLVFNAIAAPVPGAVPVLAAVPIDGGWMNYDFTTSAGPTVFAAGIVLALSTTPNSYTAIVPAADFAITARFKVS